MSPEEHKAILKNEKLCCIERLKSAAKLQLEYWYDRKDKLNLPRADFERLLPLIPNVPVKWKPRKNWSGKFGATGEDNVFDFTFNVTHGRRVVTYYVKGFYFDKNDLKGVMIQSFRQLMIQEKGQFGLRLVST